MRNCVPAEPMVFGMIAESPSGHIAFNEFLVAADACSKVNELIVAGFYVVDVPEDKTDGFFHRQIINFLSRCGKWLSDPAFFVVHYSLMVNG